MEPEGGFATPEFEPSPAPVEAIANIVPMLPPEMFSALIERLHEQVKDAAIKTGQLCAVRGHSLHRAAVGACPFANTNGALVAWSVTVIDRDAIPESGQTEDEIVQALSSTFDALNNYFDDSLKEGEE